MPGLLLASVDLPQMCPYLARMNQGFARVFLSIKHDKVVWLDTEVNNFFMLLEILISFLLKQAIGV